MLEDNYQLSKNKRRKFSSMETILEVFQKVADNEGIAITALEKKIGASKGVLSRAVGKNTDVQSKWLLKLVENYPRYNAEWLLTGKGNMIKQEKNGNQLLDEEPIPYLTQRRKIKTESKEIYFPLYKANTRLREDPRLQVYDDDPQMFVPVSFLPQAAFPGCDHGEIATGNSMYPKVANGGMALGKVIDKTKIVFNELYGAHVKGGSPPVIKYIHRSKIPGCIKFVSERESLEDQDWPLDDITFMFRVLFIVNPS